MKVRLPGTLGAILATEKQMFVFADGSDGKHAVTHYKVIERLGYVNVVECKLETGRTHQIRVHFKFIGHPIFNDELYGGDEILKGPHSQSTNICSELFLKMCPRQACTLIACIYTPCKQEKGFLSIRTLPADMSQND